jgi:hypothetical protein
VSDRLVDASIIAERLAVPVSWVRAETRAGRLPVVTLGKYRRYSIPDVDAYINELKTGGGPRFRRHTPSTPSGGSV